MSESVAFGRRLGKAFQVKGAESLVTRGALKNAEISVTRIKADYADNVMTAPVVDDNAFLVMLQLRDWPKRILWADDKPVRADPLSVGSVSVFDLRCKWIGLRVCPIDQLNFYLPRPTLDRIADIEGLRRVAEFDHDPKVGAQDATVWNLGCALLPAFKRSREANRLFVDSLTSAVAIHILHTYGGKERLRSPETFELTPKQTRVAQEMLSGDLAGNICVASLATECGLSISYFIRAFRKSVGKTPHKWLLCQRVENAMELLRAGRLALDDVALICGFVDRRHLVRAFRSEVGMSPEAWRHTMRH